MAYDGITTKNMVTELNQNIIGARVEKIYVPNKNDIYFLFHTQNRGSLKLLISIDANNARIHFTKQLKENPIKAPQICMILRKHLQGGKLVSIKQLGLDRVVIFTFQNLNELGDLVEKRLMVELMGKYSNLILVNDQNKVIDAMRHVDITMSSVREVLPNKEYIFPSTLGKNNFLDLTCEQFESILTQNNDTVYTDALLCNSFIGFSKSFSHELLSSFHLINCPIDEKSSKLLFQKLSSLFKELDEHVFSFRLLETGKDFVLDDTASTSTNLEASWFLDDFYFQKESVSIIKNAKLNLKRDVDAHLTKLRKKLDIVNSTIEEAKDYETYRIYGELLNCHMHLLKTGMDAISVTNFYDNNQEVNIPLQKNLSPSRNAQNYFKKYNKAKNSLEHASQYQKEYEKDIDYLSSVLYEIDSASNLSEVDEVREELILQGYLAKRHRTNKYKEAPSTPLCFEKDGIKILVGRNNIQNDRLTFRIAKKSDMWLHVKKFHGSHVIIQSDTIPDEVLLYAASLAVSHSEAKLSSKVEVDYCLVKYVHKENESKPGMVVYTDYHTIIVD